MIEWATKRKSMYVLGALAVLVILSAYPLYSAFNKAPSCYDKIQNQEETGVDCGGPCTNLCGNEVKELKILWAQAYKVRDGLYDMVALVENPNISAGIKNINYRFEAYSQNSNLIAEVSGSTFVNPKERFVIFEPNIETQNDVPYRVAFGFTDTDPTWVKTEDKSIKMTVKNKKLSSEDTTPQLDATIVNDSIDNIAEIDLSALIYGSRDIPIAVSSSYIDFLPGGESEDAFFKWTNPITKVPKGGICTAPVDALLVFDRSGSMDDDSQDPPQPLTDAKNAAVSFLDNLDDVDQVGLVSFATTASNPIDQTLTRVHTKTKEALDRIEIFTDSIQHTNLGDAIKSALQEIGSVRHSEDAKRAIVVLTDGIASRPLNPEDENDEKYPEEYAKNIADSARDSEISLYVIGLGGSVNTDFLQGDIASTPDRYYKATSSKELERIYNEIAEAVCKEEYFTTEIFVRTNTLFEEQ